MASRAPDDMRPPALPISVVVVTYNYARYLPACIDSIVRQSMRPAEIIVVDDASTDATEEVVANLGHDIRYIRHTSNGGPARARNTALRAAAHDLVAFVDADDRMRPGNLEAKARTHRRHREAVLAFTNARLIDENGDEIGIGNPSARSELVTPEDAFRRLVESNPFYTSTVTLAKEVAESVGGFDEEMRHGEDWDLWLRMSTRGAIHYDAAPLVDHRIHTFSLRRANFQEHADLAAMKRMFRKADADGELAGHGTSFDEVYWRNYFRMLHNKPGLLTGREVLRLYREGLAGSGRRRGPARRDAALLAKATAFGVLPERVLRRIRGAVLRRKHRVSRSADVGHGRDSGGGGR